MVKRKFWVLGVVLLLSLIKCSFSVEESVTINGESMSLATFTSAEGDFSLIYPEPWVLIEPEGSYLFRVKDPNEEAFSFIAVEVLNDKVERSSEKDELITESIEKVKSSFTDFKVLSRENTIIDDKNADILVCTFKSDIGVLKSYFCYIEIDKRIYHFALLSRLRDFDTYSILYQRILEKIEINE